MVIAALDDATIVALFSAVIVLLLAAIGGLWKLATQLATLTESVTGLVERFLEVNRRIAKIERHQDDHDAWHMDRLDRGKDLRS